MTLARIFVAVPLALAVCLSASAEGDPNAGIQKKQMCEGCHGIAGFRTAYPVVYTAPKLGGQNPSTSCRRCRAIAPGRASTRA